MNNSEMTRSDLVEQKILIENRILELDGLNADEVENLVKNFVFMPHVGSFQYSWYFPNYVSTIRMFRARTNLELAASKAVVVKRADLILDVLLPSVIRL